jgi:hypothetical protein
MNQTPQPSTGEGLNAALPEADALKQIQEQITADLAAMDGGEIAARTDTAGQPFDAVAAAAGVARNMVEKTPDQPQG